MIGYTKRYFSSINTELIDESIKELQEVGHGGSFTDRDLTLNNYSKEVWYSDILPGGMKIQRRVREVVQTNTQAE